MSDIFRVSTDLGGDIPIVHAAGEIDVSSAPELQSALQEIPASGVVIVDLTEVLFIDSSGLSALVSAHRRFQEAVPPAEVRLVISRPQILKVLEVTGLSDTFIIFPSLEAAQ